MNKYFNENFSDDAPAPETTTATNKEKATESGIMGKFQQLVIDAGFGKHWKIIKFGTFGLIGLIVIFLILSFIPPPVDQMSMQMPMQQMPMQQMPMQQMPMQQMPAQQMPMQQMPMQQMPMQQVR